MSSFLILTSFVFKEQLRKISFPSAVVAPVGSTLLLISRPFERACGNIYYYITFDGCGTSEKISTHSKKCGIDIKYTNFPIYWSVSCFNSELLYCSLFFFCMIAGRIYAFFSSWTVETFCLCWGKPTVWVDWIYFICDQYFKQIHVYFSDHPLSSSLIIWEGLPLRYWTRVNNKVL